MKRKIFNQISLLLAIFTVAISLSACGTTKSTDTYTGIDENSGIIQTLDATNTPSVQNISTGTLPTYNQGEAPTPRTSQS